MRQAIKFIITKTKPHIARETPAFFLKVFIKFFARQTLKRIENIRYVEFKESMIEKKTELTFGSKLHLIIAKHKINKTKAIEFKVINHISNVFENTALKQKEPHMETQHRHIFLFYLKI